MGKYMRYFMIILTTMTLGWFSQRCYSSRDLAVEPKIIVFWDFTKIEGSIVLDKSHNHNVGKIIGPYQLRKEKIDLNGQTFIVIPAVNAVEGGKAYTVILKVSTSVGPPTKQLLLHMVFSKPKSFLELLCWYKGLSALIISRLGKRFGYVTSGRLPMHQWTMVALRITPDSLGIWQNGRLIKILEGNFDLGNLKALYVGGYPGMEGLKGKLDYFKLYYGALSMPKIVKSTKSTLLEIIDLFRNKFTKVIVAIFVFMLWILILLITTWVMKYARKRE